MIGVRRFEDGKGCMSYGLWTRGVNEWWIQWEFIVLKVNRRWALCQLGDNDYIHRIHGLFISGKDFGF